MRSVTIYILHLYSQGLLYHTLSAQVRIYLEIGIRLRGHQSLDMRSVRCLANGDTAAPNNSKANGSNASPTGMHRPQLKKAATTSALPDVASIPHIIACFRRAPSVLSPVLLA